MGANIKIVNLECSFANKTAHINVQLDGNSSSKKFCNQENYTFIIYQFLENLKTLNNK
jgi:flagellar hook assembly protein FlgD